MTNRFEAETKLDDSKRAADRSPVQADWSRSDNSILLASDLRSSSTELVKQNVLPQLELVDNENWKANFNRSHDKWGQPRLDDTSELQRQKARLSKPETPGSDNNNSESLQRQQAREKAKDTFEPPVKDGPDNRNYEVKKGDNLWKIAQRELGPASSNEQIQKMVKRIADLNQMKNPDLISPGQKIRLPVVKPSVY